MADGYGAFDTLAGANRFLGGSRVDDGTLTAGSATAIYTVERCV